MKEQFRKDYSQFRKSISQFRSRMESNNYPCGYDDMLYENFNHGLNEWLKSKPIIKKVNDLKEQSDGKEYYYGITKQFIHANYKKWIDSKGNIFWSLGNNKFIEIKRGMK